MIQNVNSLLNVTRPLEVINKTIIHKITINFWLVETISYHWRGEGGEGFGGWMGEIDIILVDCFFKNCSWKTLL